ncbi:hypothetical protein Syun_003444 [Stephania yunnanensis]|uniref:Uncharacterized protein n=1 Tax=Stephania yunnanensis TaxID=152371 RepID=A0AAP0L2T7_9MAGN
MVKFSAYISPPFDNIKKWLSPNYVTCRYLSNRLSDVVTHHDAKLEAHPNTSDLGKNVMPSAFPIRSQFHPIAIGNTDFKVILRYICSHSQKRSPIFECTRIGRVGSRESGTEWRTRRVMRKKDLPSSLWNSVAMAMSRIARRSCSGLNNVRDFAILLADALSVIPTAVLRNLSDKLYEKRKNATQEVSSSPFPAEILDFDVVSRNFDRSEDFKLFMNRIVGFRCAD